MKAAVSPQQKAVFVDVWNKRIYPGSARIGQSGQVEFLQPFIRRGEEISFVNKPQGGHKKKEAISGLLLFLHFNPSVRYISICYFLWIWYHIIVVCFFCIYSKQSIWFQSQLSFVIPQLLLCCSVLFLLLYNRTHYRIMLQLYLYRRTVNYLYRYFLFPILTFLLLFS